MTYEVGRGPAVQVQDVHSGHGETGTVDETANVTVELDKVQAVLQISTHPRRANPSRYLLFSTGRNPPATNGIFSVMRRSEGNSPRRPQPPAGPPE